jgi:hypothetical protein
MSDTTKIDNIDSSIAVNQDRLQITDDGDGWMWVKPSYDTQPLTFAEPHLDVSLHTEHGSAELRLDAQQMDALADAIHTVQRSYNDE